MSIYPFFFRGFRWFNGSFSQMVILNSNTFFQLDDDKLQILWLFLSFFFLIGAPYLELKFPYDFLLTCILDDWNWMNAKLQAMMKDPFGNYVVQKVLETCDDQSLELILSRIRVHLNVLKKYTYGKHIVSRIEKLIATGGEGSLDLS